MKGPTVTYKYPVNKATHLYGTYTVDCKLLIKHWLLNTGECLEEIRQESDKH